MYMYVLNTSTCTSFKFATFPQLSLILITIYKLISIVMTRYMYMYMYVHVHLSSSVSVLPSYINKHLSLLLITIHKLISIVDKDPLFANFHDTHTMYMSIIIKKINVVILSVCYYFEVKVWILVFWMRHTYTTATEFKSYKNQNKRQAFYKTISLCHLQYI